MDLVVFLFDEFETLDAFGPVEVLGKLKSIAKISFVSLNGGCITSSQQVPVITDDFDSALKNPEYILLIPGGYGTRKEVYNKDLLEAIRQLANNARFVLTVCTGSALLARTGLLDGKKATTNKMAFDWVAGQGSKVDWVKKARWVRDGNIYTSAGVSAGIDMALGFVTDNYGPDRAEAIAKAIEYVWNRDSAEDIFSSLY
ncbi:MAG: DJ-1/PfpI family protein [Firmicutes bacterium]|nr:DJ-1/PfpI family protein [Bacillota bacterium]